MRELQRLVGKKTEEVEVLRMGIEIAREKKLLSPADDRLGDRGSPRLPRRDKRAYP